MRLHSQRYSSIALRSVFALVALALVFFSLSSTTRVNAADPSVFTSVGCSVGNYSCVRANGGTIPPEPGDPTQFTQAGCAAGNFACLTAAGGATTTAPATATASTPAATTPPTTTP